MLLPVQPFVRFLALLLVFSAVTSASASASDLAPTPNKAPRTPVDKQNLTSHQPVIPTSRTLDGPALAVDSDKIRLGGLELRLFGVVPPQLSASFGPQARATLDRLTQNTTVHCQIRDRANDGRLLASCSTASNVDLAMELLHRGLAVTARGSLVQTELATPYATAEQTAQAQKLGLWSGVQAPPPAPSPISKPDVAPTPALQPATIAQSVTQPVKDLMQKVDPVPASVLAELPSTEKDKKAEAALKEVAATTASVIASNPDTLAEAPLQTEGMMAAPSSWLERYQLLVTGILMLLTALSVIGAVLYQRHTDKKDEMRAIAAALRGELMAARAVCLARFQQMMDCDDIGLSWPRIRILVFQAHVGRIGQLGAEMARQISSIYGLASDYAAYYQSSPADAPRTEGASKRQALQKLINHIDTVMPRLASIESKEPWLGSVSLFSRKAAPALTSPIEKAEAASLPASETSSSRSLPSSTDMAANTNRSISFHEPVMNRKEEDEPKGMLFKVPEDDVSVAKKTEAADKLSSSLKPLTETEATNTKNEPAADKNMATATVEKTIEKTEDKAETEAETATTEKKTVQTAPTSELVKSSIPSETNTKSLKKKPSKTSATTQTKTSTTDKNPSEVTALMSSTWSSLKQIKDFLQDKLVPHPETITPENEEYLEMLRAEAEAFATYDSTDNDNLFGSKKKSGGRG